MLSIEERQYEKLLRMATRSLLQNRKYRRRDYRTIAKHLDIPNHQVTTVLASLGRTVNEDGYVNSMHS